MNVAADVSAVGEPKPPAGEAPSVSDIEPDSVSSRIFDVDIVVLVGDVLAVSVVFGS